MPLRHLAASLAAFAASLLLSAPAWAATCTEQVYDGIGGTVEKTVAGGHCASISLPSTGLTIALVAGIGLALLAIGLTARRAALPAGR